jgi:hypothetical protein
MDIYPFFFSNTGYSEESRYRNMEPEDYICGEGFYYHPLIVNWKKSSIYYQNKFKRIEVVDRNEYLIKICVLILNANRNFPINRCIISYQNFDKKL